MYRMVAAFLSWSAPAAAEEVGPATPAAPAAVEVVPTHDDAPVSLGPSFGGGMLASAALEVLVGGGVRLQADLGMRFGLSAQDLYPNVGASVGAVGAWGPRRVRHGAFVVAGASAPLGFFDAWAGVGYALELRGKRMERRGLLEVGPAVYLVRDLPSEVGLDSPAFVYLRYSVPFELG